MKFKNKQISAKQIDLHISEYNSLTTRQTYYMNMQIVLLTVGVAWGVVIASIWNKNFECGLIWSLILGWQLVDFIYAYCFYDSYLIVAYLESELKPKIIKIIKTSNFWEYETFLSKKRGKAQMFFEFSNVFIMLLIIIIGIYFRFYGWISWDWIGLIINIIIWIFIARLTMLAMKIRKNNWTIV